MNNASRYKIAFFAALAVIVALAGWLILDWRSAHRAKTSVAAEAPTSDAMPAPSPAATATDVPLSPVQLTPEGMQSIGVKLGTAEIQNVSDAVRATGNVEVDERRIAAVQTRFPGWIRNVYADASYQFIRKGEPL
ncbi:MAG TPA: efflux RND transporter periplasmic adaptor subunit, partial [Candidatus Angelobacter sp.]|nr:efflux RND transporter periplasmic adaptor subunit [Candidatus Angelobacter sp.]